MNYAFIDGTGLVLNIIVGPIDAEQHQRFLDDQYAICGAVAMLEVPDGATAWIGGRYDSAEGFLPPEPPAETIVDDAI